MQTAELRQLLAVVDGALPVQVYVDQPVRRWRCVETDIPAAGDTEAGAGAGEEAGSGAGCGAGCGASCGASCGAGCGADCGAGTAKDGRRGSAGGVCPGAASGYGGPERVEGYFEIGTLALEWGWGPAGSYPCITLSLGREV